jgi:uroporphyrinogen-III synthase
MIDKKVEQDAPLRGINVLVTRAETQAKAFCDKLRELGAEPIELAVIEICPPASWQELDLALERLDYYDWIIFASANATRSFASRWQATGRAKKIALGAIKPRIAVIGKNTKQVAQDLGFTVAFSPSSFVAETFIEEFVGERDLTGQKFLWPRTDLGRSYIQDEISKASGLVDIVQAYKTTLPKDAALLSKHFHQLIEDRCLHAITLLSAQTAANLATIADIGRQGYLNDRLAAKKIDGAQAAFRIGALLKDITVLSIGPQTTASAREHLGKVDLEATPHNTDGLIVALLKHFTVDKTSNPHTNDIVIN